MKPVSDIAAAEESLRSYCERVDFQGWDPWDALASPLFRVFPFNLRLPRWAGNHLIKISPVNIRPLLGIRRDCFAKGLALFLSAYVLRAGMQKDQGARRLIPLLYQRLMEKMIPGYSGPCWGTNVAYQTRAFFVPENTPSLVHTAFAVEAILDLNEFQPDDTLVRDARGACAFILNDLHIFDTPDGICFSYTPQDRSRVINVTALAARMLARTGRIGAVPEFIEKARRAARFVVSRQAEDGSWLYGEDPIHHWIDNYHTGFVLEALEDYRRYADDDSVDSAVNRGAEFYRKRLFREDGTPKFSPQSVYPIDGHCIAQGILTFTRLKDRRPDFLPFARRIARWGITRFQDPSGYFYFQRRRRVWNRIPHIRWVQAWMLLALNRLLLHSPENRKREGSGADQD